MDSDVRCWTCDGVSMTPIENPPAGKCRELAERWLDSHCEGEWMITPSYMFFELSSDAVLFRLGFSDVS